MMMRKRTANAYSCGVWCLTDGVESITNKVSSLHTFLDMLSKAKKMHITRVAFEPDT